jgi:sphingomyelin phosphodiesterase acid-like 3
MESRFIRRLRWALFTVLVPVMASCSSSLQSVSPPPPRLGDQPAQWLLVSDVHFSPFDDPNLVQHLIQAPASEWHRILASSQRPPSPYFSDTNFALFESALRAMQATLRNPPVVIVAGDSMAHHFPEQFAKFAPSEPQSAYDSFVDKTIAFLALEFKSAFPNSQFLIAIGNNDGYCGNYMSTPNSPFLAHMAKSWEPLVNRTGGAPDFVRDFSKGGYYQASLALGSTPSPAIVTNSVFWSAIYQNRCGTSGADPGTAELNWLATALSSAAAPAILMTHIPPGIDEFASIGNDAATPLYREKYTQRLLRILSNQSVSVRAFLLGHIHHATFEIVPVGNTQVGTIGIPSISPNQGNNPAFIVGLFQPGSPAIADATTYALPLGTMQAWSKLYSFNAAYGLDAYDVPNLLTLQTAIAHDPTVRSTFFNYYNSGSTTATPDPGKWPWYWCGHTNLTPDTYATCVQQTNPGEPR